MNIDIIYINQNSLNCNNSDTNSVYKGKGYELCLQKTICAGRSRSKVRKHSSLSE